MNQKFSIGDRVCSRYVPHSSGFITDILIREDDPSPTWYPKEDDYIPPKMPLVCLYKIDSINVYLHENTIEYDKDYYKMINREKQLKELGI